MGDSCELGDANIVCDATAEDADEDDMVVSKTKRSCWTRR